MFYITTPIPYVNGDAHLGHLLEALFNDTLARYKRRLLTEQVIFSMGLDQHGLKIHQKAVETKMETGEFVKIESDKFKKLWADFEITHDVFVETSSNEHKIVAQLVWKKLAAKNLIYKKSYTGLYCVGCEAFYSEGQLTEQGDCPIHGTKPIEMSEENYFFKLSHFQDNVLEFLKNAKIAPDGYRKEWLNFTEKGLEDVSISREKKNLPWGIPLPDDENQVMYIWFEALINYLTGLISLDIIDRILEFPLQKEEFEDQLWEEIKEKMPIDFQYMGKDMPRFHLVLWPAMLTALKLPLTKVNFVHGFINDNEGRKMSKSLGNGVSPYDLIDKFGIEGARYVILGEINPLDDTSFDWKNMIASYNSNLADNLGNLVVRVSNLIEKNLNGVIDIEKYRIKVSEKLPTTSENQKVGSSLEPSLNGTPENLEKDFSLDLDLSSVYHELETYNPQKALQKIFRESSKINEFLEQTRPWTLAKNPIENHEKIESILGHCAYYLQEIGKILAIFLPQTGDQIYQIFNSDRIVKAPILFVKVEEGEK